MQATQDDVDVVGDVLGVHLFGPDERVEGSSVAGAKLHGIFEPIDGFDDVVVGCERVRHLPSGTENGTQVPGDVLHHRLFGDEEVRLVGHILGLVVVQIGHVVLREDLVRCLFGADCGFRATAVSISESAIVHLRSTQECSYGSVKQAMPVSVEPSVIADLNPSNYPRASSRSYSRCRQDRYDRLAVKWNVILTIKSSIIMPSVIYIDVAIRLI